MLPIPNRYQNNLKIFFRFKKTRNHLPELGAVTEWGWRGLGLPGCQSSELWHWHTAQLRLCSPSSAFRAPSRTTKPTALEIFRRAFQRSTALPQPRDTRALPSIISHSSRSQGARAQPQHFALIKEKR